MKSVLSRLWLKYKRRELPAAAGVAVGLASRAWTYGWLPFALASWSARRAARPLVQGPDARPSAAPRRPLVSALCTQSQHESEEFRAWCERMGESHSFSRKQWEFCFIAEALHERGLLRPGARGLGFAVGREPLAALFASYGCEVVATDLHTDAATAAGWSDTNQHASSLDALNDRGVCDPEAFRRLVTFRFVDMNAIPDDLVGFDFVWSACALEHLGSIRQGEQFIHRAMQCLKPGGVAVHTTEFNVSFGRFTPDNCETVVFRRRDIERIASTLQADGHAIELDLSEGDGELDRFVDLPPYRRPHLKLLLFNFVSCISTSIGLLVEKRRDG